MQVYKPLLTKTIPSAPETIKNSLIPAWLYAGKALPALNAIVHRAAARLEENIPTNPPLNEDLWNFDRFWNAVRENFTTINALYTALENRLKKIEKLKEKFRPLAASSIHPLHRALSSYSTKQDSTYYLPSSSLELIPDGISGSYFLKDTTGSSRFVIKPIDEDCGSLHNPKGYATPFTSSPIRSHMPIYASSLREAAISQIAARIGAAAVAPQTVLAILHSEQFHDFSEGVSLSEINRYREHCGDAIKEKLCSVQEFIPNAKSLSEVLQELQSAGLSDEEIASRFDQNDIESAHLLIWVSGDTDAHGGNLLVYAKGIDAIGNEIFGIKKIDNGLSFPEKNGYLRNHLSYLPNAKEPLSESLKAKIAALNAVQLSEALRNFGLNSAIPALQERISLIQEAAQKPGTTLKDIHKLLSGKKK